jgi:cysteine synthase
MEVGNRPDHKLRVYSDVTQLIASVENPTPLVRVNRTNTNENLQLYLKLERYNPLGLRSNQVAIRSLNALPTFRNKLWRFLS